MKILLIDPPFHRLMGIYRFYFPLGLASIASVLQQAGHEVLIYDADHDEACNSASVKEFAQSHHLYVDAVKDDSCPIWTELLHTLTGFAPDAVGISVLTPKVAAAKKIARLVKEFNRGIPIFVGGEHVTVRAENLLGGDIDYVIKGEGEPAMAELEERLKDRTGNRKIISAPPVHDLDSLPLPAIECLDRLGSYRQIDLGLLMDGRGCPYSCGFCSLATIWGRRVRYHSVDRVVEEMVLRKERYGVNYFSFRNGTFTLNRKRIIHLCQVMKARGLDVKWECLTRVDMIDEELLQVMMSSGCDTIRVGIESGSQKILNYMNKNITLEQIRSASAMLNRIGIFWSSYFMLGVPIETEETVKATMNLIAELDPPFVSLARFSPLPGTPMYDDAVRGNEEFDEATTDWTWAANHSMGQSFVRNMDGERFLTLLEEATKLIKIHNTRHAQIRSDRRLK